MLQAPDSIELRERISGTVQISWHGDARKFELTATRLQVMPKGLETIIAVAGNSRDPATLRCRDGLITARADWFRQTRAFSIAKAQRELGYVARVGLAEGLLRTAAWYRANGYL